MLLPQIHLESVAFLLLKEELISVQEELVTSYPPDAPTFVSLIQTIKIIKLLLKMTQFKVPTRSEVSENNQAIFDNLQKNLGFVPNLYATFALNDTALSDYLTLQNRKSTLRAKEREVINLVVSQVNECAYCLAAHTALGKMNGFTDEQILEIRTGKASFDAQLNALANFVKDATIRRGKPSAESVEQLFAVGYTQANLIDILIVIGDKIVSNFLHGVTQIPIDFPAAQPLDVVAA
jgi:uncharacterized peroxidase-related enzyme